MCFWSEVRPPHKKIKSSLLRILHWLTLTDRVKARSGSTIWSALYQLSEARGGRISSRESRQRFCRRPREEILSSRADKCYQSRLGLAKRQTQRHPHCKMSQTRKELTETVSKWPIIVKQGSAAGVSSQSLKPKVCRQRSRGPATWAMARPPRWWIRSAR